MKILDGVYEGSASSNNSRTPKNICLVLLCYIGSLLLEWFITILQKYL